MESYFKALRSEVMSALDAAEDKLKTQSLNVSRNLELYNQITGKEELKNAVENKYSEQNEISEKIKEILNKSLSSQEESVLTELQENYDKQQTQEGLVDFEKPQKIKEEILAKI